MSLPRTPSFQHIHLYLINNLSSLIRPSQVDVISFIFSSYIKDKYESNGSLKEQGLLKYNVEFIKP
jgi:hypothetical protein